MKKEELICKLYPSGQSQFSVSHELQDQIDCIECQQSKKRLNEDIVKLKNFVNKYKPHLHNYKKSIEARKQYEKDFKEWDDLMRL